MPTYDTLLYNGTEKTFSAWGFPLDGIVGTRNIFKPDTFDAMDVTANPTAGPAFPFEAQVAVYYARASSTGAPNSFSGGTCKFQGRRVLSPNVATVNKPGLQYHFEGPWYDLQQVQFLQPYLGVAGNFNPGEICLFTSTQNAAGFLYVPISVGDQIQAILQWLLDQYSAQGMSAPFQYVGRTLNSGHIDLTRTGALGVGFTYTYPVASGNTIDAALYNLYLPSMPGMKPISCAEALVKCLELSPRTNIAFDYTTSPPTIHVQSVDNLSAVSLPFWKMRLAGKSTQRPQLLPRGNLAGVAHTQNCSNRRSNPEDIFCW